MTSDVERPTATSGPPPSVATTGVVATNSGATNSTGTTQSRRAASVARLTTRNEASRDHHWRATDAPSSRLDVSRPPAQLTTRWVIAAVTATSTRPDSTDRSNVARGDEPDVRPIS